MIFLIVHFFSFPFFVYPYINLFSQSFLCPESYYFFFKIKHACIIKLQMFFLISPSFISFPYKIQSLIFLLLFILFRIIFIFFFKTSSFTGFFPINFRKKKIVRLLQNTGHNSSFTLYDKYIFCIVILYENYIT